MIGPVVLARIIATLKSGAGEGGVVTFDAVNDALGSDEIDIEELFAAMNRAGLTITDENAGPPVFPRGYAGPRVVENDPD